MTRKELFELPTEKLASLFVYALESVENVKYYSSILPKEEEKKLDGSYRAALEATKFELEKDIAVRSLYGMVVSLAKKEGRLLEEELIELSEEQAARAASKLLRSDISSMSDDVYSSYNDSCYFCDREHDEIYFGVLQEVYCRIKKLAIEE